MDILNAMLGAIIGSLAMIFATKFIEKSKLSAMSELYVKSLYIELEDLNVYSERAIGTLYSLLVKVSSLQCNQRDIGDIKEVYFSRKYPVELVYKHYENCLLILTLEQRDALKTLHILLERSNIYIDDLSKLKNDINQIEISFIKEELSIMCNVYFLTSGMVSQEERFKINDKYGFGIYDLVLKQLGYDPTNEGIWDAAYKTS